MLRLAVLVYWATPVVLLLCLISLLLGNSFFGIFKLVGLQLPPRCVAVLRLLHAGAVVGSSAVAALVWASYCNADVASPTMLVEVYLDHGRCLPASTLASLALLALLFVDRATLALLQGPPPTALHRVARAALVAQAFVALSGEDGTVGLPLAVLVVGRVADAIAMVAPRVAKWSRRVAFALAGALGVLVLAEMEMPAKKTASITLFAILLC